MGGSLRASGSGLSMASDDKSQDDMTWTVDCICGVQYDDGEEMIECESCCVWVHIICEHVPRGAEHYICQRCVSNGRDKDKVEKWNEMSEAERNRAAVEAGREAQKRAEEAALRGASSVFSSQLWKSLGLVPKLLGERRVEHLAAMEEAARRRQEERRLATHGPVGRGGARPGRRRSTADENADRRANGRSKGRGTRGRGRGGASSGPTRDPKAMKVRACMTFDKEVTTPVTTPKGSRVSNGGEVFSPNTTPAKGPVFGEETFGKFEPRRCPHCRLCYVKSEGVGAVSEGWVLCPCKQWMHLGCHLTAVPGAVKLVEVGEASTSGRGKARSAEYSCVRCIAQFKAEAEGTLPKADGEDVAMTDAGEASGAPAKEEPRGGGDAATAATVGAGAEGGKPSTSDADLRASSGEVLDEMQDASAAPATEAEGGEASAQGEPRVAEDGVGAGGAASAAREGMGEAAEAATAAPEAEEAAGGAEESVGGAGEESADVQGVPAATGGVALVADEPSAGRQGEAGGGAESDDGGEGTGSRDSGAAASGAQGSEPSAAGNAQESADSVDADEAKKPSAAGVQRLRAEEKGTESAPNSPSTRTTRGGKERATKSSDDARASRGRTAAASAEPSPSPSGRGRRGAAAAAASGGGGAGVGGTENEVEQLFARASRGEITDEELAMLLHQKMNAPARRGRGGAAPAPDKASDKKRKRGGDESSSDEDSEDDEDEDGSGDESEEGADVKPSSKRGKKGGASGKEASSSSGDEEEAGNGATEGNDSDSSAPVPSGSPSSPLPQSNDSTGGTLSSKKRKHMAASSGGGKEAARA